MLSSENNNLLSKIITKFPLVVIVAFAIATLVSFLIDHALINYFQNLQPQLQLYKDVIYFAAKWFSLFIPAIAIVFIYKSDERMTVGSNILLSVLVTIVISQILHVIFSSCDRPFAAMGLSPLVSHEPDPSFPSDHAAVGFAIGVSILLKQRKIGVICLTIALVASFSRVLSLLHWPSDMVAGAFLGTTIAISIQFIRKRIYKWLSPSVWYDFFEKDNNFRIILSTLRMLISVGVLFGLLVQQSNMFTYFASLFTEPRLNPQFLIIGAWSIYMLYVILTTKLFLRLTNLVSNGVPTSTYWLNSQSADNTKLWFIIVCDTIMYAMFYGLSSHIKSVFFVLLVLPLVISSLFRDIVCSLKALALVIMALTAVLFFFWITGVSDSSLSQNLSPKQGIVLEIFLPRALTLFLSFVPIVWLIERHTRLDNARSRYESLVESIPENIIRKDLNGVITYANTAFCELNHLTKNQVIGQTDEFLYGKEIAKKYKEDDQKVISTKHILPINEKHIPFNQTDELDVEGSKIPVCDRAGNVIEVQIIFRDITERIQRETQLETLMRTTPDNIYFKDTNSAFLRISSAMAKRFSLKDPKDAYGKTDSDFFADPHAQQALQDEKQIMATGGSIQAKEEEETWPDGSKSWVSTTKQCLRDGLGNIVGTFGISRDIGELIKSREELKKANSRLDLQLETAEKIAHFGFWEYDIQNTQNTLKVKATNGIYPIFNLTPQQDGVKLEDLRRMIYPDDLNIWDEKFSIVTSAKPVLPFDIRIRLSDGSIRYLHAKVIVNAPNGRPSSITGFVQDLTAWKKEEIRAKGLELTIDSFRHMIPGKADEVSGAIELTKCEDVSNECKLKSLAFIFMIRHKADEVRSLLYGNSQFQNFLLAEIWEKAWLIARDMDVPKVNDLKIVYGHNSDKDLYVKGAFYTAAVNILYNARQHGSAPYVVWTVVNDNLLEAVFADGGPNENSYKSKGTSTESGVGLKLVKRILEIVNGTIQRQMRAELEIRFPDFPADFKDCKTFFHVTTPLPLNTKEQIKS